MQVVKERFAVCEKVEPHQCSRFSFPYQATMCERQQKASQENAWFQSFPARHRFTCKRGTADSLATVAPPIQDPKSSWLILQTFLVSHGHQRRQLWTQLEISVPRRINVNLVGQFSVRPCSIMISKNDHVVAVNLWDFDAILFILLGLVHDLVDCLDIAVGWTSLHTLCLSDIKLDVWPCLFGQPRQATNHWSVLFHQVFSCRILIATARRHHNLVQPGFHISRLGDGDLGLCDLVFAADIFELPTFPVVDGELILYGRLHLCHQVMLSHDHQVVHMGEDQSRNLVRIVVHDAERARIDFILLNGVGKPITLYGKAKQICGQLQPPKFWRCGQAKNSLPAQW